MWKGGPSIVRGKSSRAEKQLAGESQRAWQRYFADLPRAEKVRHRTVAASRAQGAECIRESEAMGHGQEEDEDEDGEAVGSVDGEAEKDEDKDDEAGGDDEDAERERERAGSAEADEVATALAQRLQRLQLKQGGQRVRYHCNDRVIIGPGGRAL